MNITEANATMRVLHFLAGDVDHCDETTRRKIAEDIVLLQSRSYDALHAGLALPVDEWDEALCRVTFEEA